MSATETTPTALPTEATQFGTLAIKDLETDFSSDGSKITDLAAAAKIFDAAFPAVQDWLDATRKVAVSTADFCQVSFQIRTLCRNNENGIDWAGNTAAYSTLFNARVTRMQQVAGMTETEIRKFSDAVRQFSSNNDGLRLFQARYLAAHDPATGAKSDKLKDAIVPVATGGVKITAPMAAALKAEAKKQVKQDGTILDKFKDVANYAKAGETVGQKKAAKKAAKNEDGSSEPSAKFEQVRAEVVKVEKKGDKITPHLAPLTVGDQVLHLATSAAVQLFGNKPDTAYPFLSFENLDRPAVTEKWQAIANLATAVANGLNEPEKVDFDSLSSLFWNPGTKS